MKEENCVGATIEPGDYLEWISDRETPLIHPVAAEKETTKDTSTS